MPNRLQFEQSPYLLQHRENPVDWRPWGSEAFQTAREEDKPVFLSIGYSTCHWCHVMAHESFEDETVAEAINRDFIPIKVDREERPDVDAVYMPKIMHTSKTFEDVLDAVANKGLKIKSPSPGDTIDFNGLEIEVLGPQREYKDFNNNSIVLKVNAGETAFLFTGDAEETAEKDILQAGYDLQADVLKVGHHGSSTSSSQAFLQAVKPKYAVISVGVGNSYHHPEEEALQRLQSIGAEIYRTDLQGDIVCTTDGKNIAFNCNSVSGAEVYADAAKNNTPAEEVVYIANKKSKKFHLESCASLPDEENRIYLEDREEAISLGYTPCGTCKP